VTAAVDGEEGLRLARSEQPDIVLLDMLGPKLSGLEVLGLGDLVGRALEGERLRAPIAGGGARRDCRA
jgi:hypothetical protein